MATGTRSWRLDELAATLGGELRGPADALIRRPVPAGTHDPEGLTFAETEPYLERVLEGPIGLVIVPTEFPDLPVPTLRTARPRQAFGHFLALYRRPLPLGEGIHAAAVVDPDAHVDPGARVGAMAVVERGARIGPGCRVYPFAYVGEDCVLEADCVLFPHAVLYQGVHLGARTVIHAGAIVGADGFGYAWDGEAHRKVPQVGGVRIGPDVEIGALTAIDRATAGETEVGAGTKIDNLVQVGHNSRIGPHTVIASLVGLSGSTEIGARVTIAGQSATSHHVRIVDDVVLAGRTGVTGDIDRPGEYFGLPARPKADAMRATVLATRLPDLFARLKRVERRLFGKSEEA